MPGFREEHDHIARGEGQRIRASWPQWWARNCSADRSWPMRKGRREGRGDGVAHRCEGDGDRPFQQMDRAHDLIFLEQTQGVGQLPVLDHEHRLESRFRGVHGDDRESALLIVGPLISEQRAAQRRQALVTQTSGETRDARRRCRALACVISRVVIDAISEGWAITKSAIACSPPLNWSYSEQISLMTLPFGSMAPPLTHVISQLKH